MPCRFAHFSAYILFPFLKCFEPIASSKQKKWRPRSFYKESENQTVARRQRWEDKNDKRLQHDCPIQVISTQSAMQNLIGQSARVCAGITSHLAAGPGTLREKNCYWSS